MMESASVGGESYRKEMAARVTAVNEIAKRRRHVQPRLSELAYLRATARSKLPARFAGDGKRRSLEGFLFPATYEFLPATTSTQLVRKQLSAFQRAWAKLDLRYARSRNLTGYDVLIIASMIEKEAVAPEERKLIAAVIYNRLKARMALGIDATIRYGLGGAASVVVAGESSSPASRARSAAPAPTRPSKNIKTTSAATLPARLTTLCPPARGSSTAGVRPRGHPRARSRPPPQASS